MEKDKIKLTFLVDSEIFFNTIDEIFNNQPQPISELTSLPWTRIKLDYTIDTEYALCENEVVRDLAKLAVSIKDKELAVDVYKSNSTSFIEAAVNKYS